MISDTIAAPMTPKGTSAIAALRISGPRTKEVAQKILGKNSMSPRTAVWTEAKTLAGEWIDSVLALYFEHPASFTGEDVLEIFPHGNPLIVKKLLRAILEIQGVRLAEPGEFTKRAFLNGKLDLVQAESVGDLIHAQSESALKNAAKLLGGKFSSRIKNLSREIIEFSAQVELDVDFTEEEADPNTIGWEIRIQKMLREVRHLKEHFREAETLNRVPAVVIYGAPNAGKSSLVNALLKEDRLLVSSLAGTTRDFVEVRLMLPGGEIRLIDTAGISSEATSELDALSMEKSRQILETADLKIHLVSAEEIPNDFGKNFSLTSAPDEIFVCSKADLLSKDQKEFFEGEKLTADEKENSLAVSSQTGEGLDSLLKKINEKLFAEMEREEEEFWITSARERNCLEEAEEGLARALEFTVCNPAVELLAFEMQNVRRALRSIVGEISSDDVLNSIFSNFCIGK